MTKQHFIRAAEIVNAIREGHWTNEPPVFDVGNAYGYGPADYDIPGHIRAVQVAEAFIKLFTEFNPRFDQTRFLVACGLVDTPAKKGRVK